MADSGNASMHAKHLGYVDGVNFTISLCLTYTLCVTALRGWIRRRLYGWDDIVVAIGTLFLVGYYAASYIGLSNGLGKKVSQLDDMPASELASLNRSEVARVILFVISIYLAKACVVAFLARTTKTRRHQVVHYITFGILGLLGIGSVIAVTVDCGNSDKYFYWDLPNTAQYCPAQPTRWQLVMAFDVFTEVILALLPLHLMWKLQMPFKKKAMIIAAFYMRIPTIALSVVGNYWAVSKYPYQRDPGLAGALITIWQTVEAAYSLAAVTISASKAFADAFATGFGWGDTFREVGNSQYMMESAASRSRTAHSRGATRTSGTFEPSHTASGTMTSQHKLSDHKNISPMATTSDEITQASDTEKSAFQGQYHQNDYNYGRPQTQGSDKSRSATGSWRRKENVNVSSQYVDPLEDEDDDAPMKLRPERKLRNTAIIEYDPTAASLQRPQGEDGREGSGSDDMFIVRNVDYSVRYDEAPILEQHKRGSTAEHSSRNAR